MRGRGSSLAVGLATAFSCLCLAACGDYSVDDNLSLEEVEKRAGIRLPPSTEVVEALDRRSSFNGDGGIEAEIRVSREELNRALHALGIYPKETYALERPPVIERPQTAPPYPENSSFKELDVPEIARYIKFSGPQGQVVVDLTEPGVRTLYLFYTLAS